MKTYLVQGIVSPDRIQIEAETEIDRLVLRRVLPVLEAFCNSERFQLEAARKLEALEVKQ